MSVLQVPTRTSRHAQTPVHSHRACDTHWPAILSHAHADGRGAAATVGIDLSTAGAPGRVFTHERLSRGALHAAAVRELFLHRASTELSAVPRNAPQSLEAENSALEHVRPLRPPPRPHVASPRCSCTSPIAPQPLLDARSMCPTFATHAVRTGPTRAIHVPGDRIHGLHASRDPATVADRRPGACAAAAVHPRWRIGAGSHRRRTTSACGGASARERCSSQCGWC